MASTAKQQSGGSQEPSMFLDILTKEEKEALLTKKMEEIRRKNEALRKRHEDVMSKMFDRAFPARREIEADKKAAHQMGRLVDPKLQVTVTPNKKPDAPRENAQRDNNRNMKGVRNVDDDKRPAKLAVGRAKRLSNMSKERLRANTQNSPGQPGPDMNNFGGERERGGGGAPPISPNTYQPGARRRGGSGRTPTQMEPRSPENENGPPPDPAFNFLSDRSREGPLPDRIRDQKNVARHPRNFGGSTFTNVQQKIKSEKEYQQQGRQGGGPPRSKMEMAMKMTGRERREYSEWKSERERIDQARIDRQLSHQGDWRREWDHDKVEQDFESDPPESGEQRTEPGRRPAGRIGSGRFDRGDSLEERKRGDGPGITVIGYAVDGQIVRLGDQIDEDTFKKDPDSLENTLESLAEYERESRGHHDQGRGRGGRPGSRGRGGQRPNSGNYDRQGSNYDRQQGGYDRQNSYERQQGGYDRQQTGYERQGSYHDRDRPVNYDRHRASSTGSDETSRSVEEQNDSLIVKIDNEFASTNRRFKTSPVDDNKSKRRSFDESSHDSNDHDMHDRDMRDRGRDRGGHQRSYSNRDRQENGDMHRGGGTGGIRRGTGRPERARRNMYRGGDDGVRSDGFREPPRGRGMAVAGRNRSGRRAGSGRLSNDRPHYHEGDSNLADVEPDIAMGTFDENWDYGDLQPGQVVQIVSAELEEKQMTLEVLATAAGEEEEGLKSPDGEEEWEDAHDFYDVKVTTIDDDDEDEDGTDPHNSSAESLERFIQEHTLKLDVNVESMVPPLSPMSGPASPDSGNANNRQHPLSVAKAMDWGAGENFSDNKSSNAGSLDTSRNAEDMTDLPADESIEEGMNKDTPTDKPEKTTEATTDNEEKLKPETDVKIIDLEQEAAESSVTKKMTGEEEQMEKKPNEVAATSSDTAIYGSSSGRSEPKNATTTPHTEPAPAAGDYDTDKAEKPYSEPTVAAEIPASPSAAAAVDPAAVKPQASSLPSEAATNVQSTIEEKAEPTNHNDNDKNENKEETPASEKLPAEANKEEKKTEIVAKSQTIVKPTPAEKSEPGEVSPEVLKTEAKKEENDMETVATPAEKNEPMEETPKAPTTATAENGDKSDSTMANGPNMTSNGEAESASPGATTEDASASKQG